MDNFAARTEENNWFDYSSKERIRHFMDKREDNKEASEDLARESLIEISDYLPDKGQKPDVAEDGVVGTNGDEIDKYRSELISISYSQSPDITSSPPPASVGKPRG